MKWLLGISLVFCGTVSSASSFELLAGGSGSDRGVYVSPVSDGGYIAVGATASFGQGETDVFAVRADAAGEILWTGTYGGPGADNGWSVHQNGEQFIIAGFSNSNGAGDYDCYLTATDLEGNQLWSRTFGGEARDRCWGVLPTADGGYILVGETVSTGFGAEDCYLVKTDASGHQSWARTYGGDQGDRCFAISETDDGGFLLVGQTYSKGAGDRDAYIIRTDDSGREIWSRTFGGPASDVGHGIDRTSDGAFLITGYTTSLADEEDDPYLIKLSDDGNIHWTRVISMPGINHTITGEQTNDGGYVLGGFSVFESEGSNSALVVKTDAEGRLQWHRDIKPSRDGRSMGYTIRATADGGAVMTGHSSEGSAGGLDLLLVKLDWPEEQARSNDR